MAVPGFQDFMLPILQLFGDEKEHNFSDAIVHVINSLKISEEDQNDMVPSGMQTKVTNRINWTFSYFKKALLIESKKRGYYNITQRGIDLINTNPKCINIKLLNQFQEFKDFHGGNGKEDVATFENISKETPTEIIGSLCSKMNSQLSFELLEIIGKMNPYSFETLVIRVLMKMGYGDSCNVTKKSGDGGIDGIISQDKLGLDNVYVQAKRWTNIVGTPEIRNFVGALTAQKSTKGIFITTSTFSKEAIKYVQSLPQYSVRLIDGEELAKYMIEYNAGVQISNTYEIKKVDLDYFDEIN